MDVSLAPASRHLSNVNFQTFLFQQHLRKLKLLKFHSIYYPSLSCVCTYNVYVCIIQAIMSLSLGDPSRFGGSADQTSAEEKSYQAAKYAEIIEILLSAGYFRARISGLSEFDKVKSTTVDNN